MKNKHTVKAWGIFNEKTKLLSCKTYPNRMEARILCGLYVLPEGIKVVPVTITYCEEEK